MDNGLYWSNMSNDDKSAYLELVNGSGARDTDLNEQYFKDMDAGEDPRPHGYENLDKDLRVIDEGVEPTIDAFKRLYALNFNCGEDHVNGLSQRGDPRYKYAAYLITNGSQKIKPEYGWVDSSKVGREVFDQTRHYDGWDSSYHDAHWNGLSAIVGFGPTEEKAIERMNSMVSKIVPQDDPAVRRFKLRRLVREGD